MPNHEHICGGVEQVHLRLDGIEKAISSRLDHVGSEMSRMRSVLYLPVKDRPDMLRLPRADAAGRRLSRGRFSWPCAPSRPRGRAKNGSPTH
ncbi:MAG TPA: hypothetical protein VF611_06940 [Pyrinomonadaceae bacterium]